MKRYRRTVASLLAAMMLALPVGGAVDMLTLLGDANLDGKVNLGDASLILKHAAMWDVSLSQSNSDLTGDGRINTLDVTTLMKQVAGWNVDMPETETDYTYSDGVFRYDLSEYADSERVVENPHKGWYIHYYDNCLTRYGTDTDPHDIVKKLPGLDHIYIRIAWSHLEPEEGVFRWELIDDVMEAWDEVGVGVAFRITCKETDKNQYYATPKWVRDAGAVGVELENAWEPDYGDPVFIEKLYSFHTAFAERYDGDPRVRYVDVGSLGDWGEGHTAFGTNTLYDYTVAMAHLEMYAELYPNTLVVVNDDIALHEGLSKAERNDILEYMKEMGMSARDDSIGTKWHFDTYGKTSVKNPILFWEVEKTAPVVLELDHYSSAVANGTWLGGTTLDLASAQTHATYAGFHGYPAAWLEENGEFAAHLANRLGYWYFAEYFSFEETESGMEYRVGLRNDGYAPSYTPFGMELTLVNGETSITLQAEDGFDVTTADNGHRFEAVFTSDSLEAGEWQAYIRMTDGDGEIDLALSLDIYEKDLGFSVGKITVK